jgi:hypothetical protein
MEPTVRAKLHDAYWRFAAERQRVFNRRAQGQPGPWTEDPILRRYKFCNAFRASDRVSQYLIANVIYAEGAEELPSEDIFLRIILFRLFSKETTWQVLEEATGGVCRATLDITHLGDVLADVRARQSIYTAAFILCAHDTYGMGAKHRNHLRLVEEMFRPGRLGRLLARARSLKEVYEALRGWPTIGAFMGYQLAVDLNYSDRLGFSEDEFTVPGPGAVRGLQKVFSDFGGQTPEQLIMRMVDVQHEQFERLGLDWSGLFGRPLHAIDCQGLFCETDKYARVAFPELKSNRVRIKQEFRDPKPAMALFYPPKWDINERVGSESRTPGADLPEGQLSFDPLPQRIARVATVSATSRRSRPRARSAA